MSIELTAVGTYATGIFDEGAAEIPAYDPDTQRLFVVNGAGSSIDVLDISDPDDNAAGGTFQFAFNGLVAIDSIQVLDVEEGGTVELFGADGSSLGTVDITATANGAIVTVDVDTDAVSRLNVTLNGSGAISDILFA